MTFGSFEDSSVLEALHCRSLQGLSYSARLGSRGIVATPSTLSSGSEPEKLAFSRLQERSVEHSCSDLVARDGTAVELDAPLVDLPTPVRGRVARERDEQAGEIDHAFIGLEGRLGHLVGRLVA